MYRIGSTQYINNYDIIIPDLGKVGIFPKILKKPICHAWTL